MISFTVEGEPVPWARASSNGKQRFTPAKVRQYQSFIKLKAAQAMAGKRPIDGPIKLSVVACFDIPKSWTKKRKAAAHWHMSKPDGDNLLKNVKDSCNTIVWHDDAQVAASSIIKRYARDGENVGLLVDVESLS